MPRRKKSLILSMEEPNGLLKYNKRHKYDFSTDDDYEEMQKLLGKAQGSLDVLAGILTPFGGDALVNQREAFLFDGMNLELLEELRALIKHLEEYDEWHNYPGKTMLKARMSALEGVTTKRLEERRARDKKYRQQSRGDSQRRLDREREFRRKDNAEQMALNQATLEECASDSPPPKPVAGKPSRRSRG